MHRFLCKILFLFIHSINNMCLSFSLFNSHSLLLYGMKITHVKYYYIDIMCAQNSRLKINKFKCCR